MLIDLISPLKGCKKDEARQFLLSSEPTRPAATGDSPIDKAIFFARKASELFLG